MRVTRLLSPPPSPRLLLMLATKIGFIGRAASRRRRTRVSTSNH